MKGTSTPRPEPKPICWHTLSVGDDDDFSNTNSPSLICQVSNPSVPLSPEEGLAVHHEFVTDEEAQCVMEQFDQKPFHWEGFEQRRKVQRYVLPKQDDDDNNNNNTDNTKHHIENQIDDDRLPTIFQTIADRISVKCGKVPKTLIIEEYPRSQLHKQFNAFQTSVTTFESSTRMGGEGQEYDDCSYFVATLPISGSMVEHVNRPKVRRTDCWDLYSTNHSTGLVLDRNSLFIKTKDFLWEWRSRISAIGPKDQEGDRMIVMKFSSLPEPNTTSDADGKNTVDDTLTDHDDINQQQARQQQRRQQDDESRISEEVPPLEDLLTVIVTTSPIRSNPSTELLERVFQTFVHGGYEFAYKCKKVIICDGCRQRDETVSKKHHNVKQSMRNGIVTESQLEDYVQFKIALRSLCQSASAAGSSTTDSDDNDDDDSGISLFCNTTVEELEERHGYGFALRHAVRECVATPYVIVIQHDRTFMRPTPIKETVQAMWKNKNKIKYVGMSMRSNLLYRDQFLGKYGRMYMDEMKSCILRPPELELDATLFGPDSHSTANMDYSGQQKLRDNIQTLIGTYKSSQQGIDHEEWLKANPPQQGKWQLSLTPTFFWYDNVHICETAHYRDFIFHPPYKMVVRGGFVEDKVSPVIKKSVERLGLREGHAKFGCFLLDDHSGMFFTGHLDGGSYLTREEKLAVKKKQGT